MMEFTYRSARSGSLLGGLGLAIVVESAVLHLWFRAHHPILAWTLTLSSVSVLGWLAMDYHALGRGTIRVDRDAVDLSVGRRARVRVPLDTIATVVRPSWRDVPGPGEPGSEDYRNLMKPASPNVLLALAEPVAVRFAGGIARRVRRLGLRLDDAAGFIAAVSRQSDEVLSLARAAAGGA